MSSPVDTWCTALILFHKYQQFLAVQDNGAPPAPTLDPKVAVLTCINLACKATEEFRKLRDFINIGHKYTYFGIQRSLVLSESIVLRSLGYNINVLTPHKHALYIIEHMAWWKFDGMPPDSA
ncbi:hypothetical protein EV182_005014, partial [Spiromyces aspiralis]